MSFLLLVLHGESSKRLAPPRNTKDRKHLQSTSCLCSLKICLMQRLRLPVVVERRCESEVLVSPVEQNNIDFIVKVCVTLSSVS